MADFTSSLYLGMGHPSTQLPPWQMLTTGRPAVLGRPALSTDVASALADLIGTETAVLARSSLHALTDCLEILAPPAAPVLVDERTYAVGQWAVDRAAGRGNPVIRVPHKDTAALHSALRRARRSRVRPVVIADGFCVTCGQSLPLAAYQAMARQHRAILVVDDTQAVGVLGSGSSARDPYGRGGGGSVPCAGAGGPDLVVVASLAKGFGAPVAVVAGPVALVDRVGSAGGSAVHASPPTTVDLLAARSALEQNAHEGDQLRRRLAQRVKVLRDSAARSGLRLVGGLFPVQLTPPTTAERARAVHAHLVQADVRTVVVAGCGEDTWAVALVTTVRHPRAALVEAGSALGAAWHATAERRHATR
jgi:8-amino-7-oxononanoate synthase